MTFSPLLKNKTYILLAIVTLIVLVLALGFVWPLFLQIQNGSAELVSEKNTAQILRDQSDQIENFKKVHDDYKPNLDKMAGLFIDPKNPVNFIEFLESMAAVSLIEPQISLVSALPDQPTATFQLSTTANFLNVMDFARRMENGPYLIQIQNVSIKTAQTDTVDKAPTGTVEAKFLILAFVKP